MVATAAEAVHRSRPGLPPVPRSGSARSTAYVYGSQRAKITFEKGKDHLGERRVPLLATILGDRSKDAMEVVKQSASRRDAAEPGERHGTGAIGLITQQPTDVSTQQQIGSRDEALMALR